MNTGFQKYSGARNLDYISKSFGPDWATMRRNGRKDCRLKKIENRPKTLRRYWTVRWPTFGSIGGAIPHEPRNLVTKGGPTGQTAIAGFGRSRPPTHQPRERQSRLA